GIALSAAALSLLLVYAGLYGTAVHIVSSAIFGTSLLLLYTSSTLYHSFRNPGVKRFFKIVDHSCIYILIAGTYTPFLLISLEGALGWTLFGIIWLIALIGIVLKIFFVHRFKIISTIAYIGMGWIIVFAIKPLIAALERGGLVLLVAGGLAYTLGVIFYAWKKMPFHHGIWHLFVIAGSVCHFFSVLFYVIPGRD
ncbi:MAG: hemolysin III family protein, partial [Smithellaceae bacterium]